MSEYVAKNWQKEPITKVDLTRMDQGIAAAHAELHAHENKAAGAHAATSISYAGSANLSANNVEGALDELDSEKAGLALANTFTSAQTQNQAAPAAGQVQPNWTYQQAGTNRIRHGLDSAGNLVVQRWGGADWGPVLTIQVGADLLLGSVDQVDGFHLRLNGQILEYSSDGQNWAPAGLPPNKIRALCRRS